MSMQSAIESELLDVTKLKRSKRDDDQKYLGKLIRKVADLSEDDWEDLSEQAQEWFNAGIDARNEGDDIPLFSDIPEDDSGDDDASEPDEEDEEVITGIDDEDDIADDEPESEPEVEAAPAKKTNGKKKPATKAKAKEPSKPKVTPKAKAKPKESKKIGAGERAKEIMLEKGMTISAEDLLGYLEDEGYTYSIHTVKVVRAEFQQAMKVLERKGMLNTK